MKCTEAELLIIDLLKNGCMTTPSSDLSGHLSSCKPCNKFFVQLTKDAGTLAQDRRMVPDADFYDRIVQHPEISSFNPVYDKIPAGRYFRLTPAFAAAAAAIIAGIWLGSGLLNVYLPKESGIQTTESSARPIMVKAFAEDVHLYDASEALLENYLAENETENETEIQP